MSGKLSDEEFQDYMSGGVRHKRVVPKRRSVPKSRVANMAKLFGGFFESLEQFANESKEEDKKKKTEEAYTTAHEDMKVLAKGGKKSSLKKSSSTKKSSHRGGYEQEEYQDQDKQEDFSSIGEVISKALSGGYRMNSAHKRPATKRPVRPVAKRVVKRPVRPAAKRPVRRSSSPARMRFM